MFRLNALLFFGVTIVVLLLLILLGVFQSEPYYTDRDMGWTVARFQLKAIATALVSYHEANKRLPPAVIVNEDGKPLYSWRVLLLPFLEQDSLYQEFHLKEPWDSPHNLQCLNKMPACYNVSVRELGPGMTPFQVLVGPGTAFELPRLKLGHLTDGVDQTILVVEGADGVPWTKPVDIAYDPNKPVTSLFGISKKSAGRNTLRSGFNITFADGQVWFLQNTVAENTLHALITRNGGEKVDLSKLGD